MIRTILSIAALTACLGTQSPALAQKPAAARAIVKPDITAAININTASAADFESLPGIGAKTAARIVEYRQKNGSFKKIEELMNVRGIGEKAFLKLRAQLTVGAQRADRGGSQH